ncbi:MAG: hypothetical protein ACXWUG_08035 [Polyangiales bacterium]
MGLWKRARSWSRTTLPWVFVLTAASAAGCSDAGDASAAGDGDASAEAGSDARVDTATDGDAGRTDGDADATIPAGPRLCVGPTSTGDGSGSDWNNVAPWSGITPIRGTTYYLREGTYEGKTLSTAAVDTKWIAIRKCTRGEAVCTAIEGWLDSMGDDEAVFTGALSVSTGRWEINGTVGGGPGAWKSGHGFKWTSPAGTRVEYIDLVGSISDVIVAHARFEQVGDTEATIVAADAIYSPGSLSSSRIEDCYFENLGGLPFFLRGGSGNIIQRNYTGNICGMSVKDAGQHCEALVLHDMDDLQFRWNFISESPSSGGLVKNNTPASDAIRIYGNVIGNGFPINCNSGPCSNWRIFNNTFYDVSGGPFGGDGAVSGLLLYDNIIYRGSSSALAGTHDYNWYSNVPSTSCSMTPAAHENVNKKYPGGCDDVTETMNPFVSTSAGAADAFRLSAPIAGWPGLDVCTLDPCTGEKRFDVDAFGKVRGADGVWDRGAFEP